MPDSAAATGSAGSDSYGSPHSPFRRRNVIRPSTHKDLSSNGSDSRSTSLKLSSPSLAVRNHSNSISGAATPSSSAVSMTTSQDTSSTSVTSSLAVSSSAFGALTGKGPTIRFSGRESPTPPVRTVAVNPSPGWEAGPVGGARHTRSATIRSSGVESETCVGGGSVMNVHDIWVKGRVTCGR